MKHLLHAIYAIILAAVVGGCGETEVDRRLARAEALMMTAPDSALAILDSIDHAPLRGRNAALHALLLTHAHYRNYIVDTDDSLITIAVDYFSRHDDPERLMTAYYCRGRVRDNIERYPEAMTDALHALDIATGRGDFFYEARAHELIGDLWFEAQSYQRAFDSFQKAGNAFKLAHRDDSHKWALASSACCLSNMGKFAAAISLLDSVNAVSAAYPALLWSNREAIMYACLLSGDLRRTETLLDSLFESGHGNVTANLFRLAQLKVLQGKVSEAKAAYDKAMLMIGGTNTTPDVMAQKINAEYLISTEEPDSADIVDVINRCLSFLEKGGAKGVAEAESAYYREQSSRMAQSSHESNFMLYAVVAVAFAAAFAGVCLYRKRMRDKETAISMKMKDIAELSDERERLDSESRLKDEEIENLSKECRNLADESYSKDSTIGLLTEKVSTLEKRYAGVRAVRPVANSIYSRMAIIKELGNIYAVYSGDRKTAKAKIGPIVMRILDEANDSKFINDVAMALDADTDGLVSEYAPTVVGKGKQNYEVFIYCMAGLTVKETSVLLNIPQSTVYGIRANIKNKIQATESARKNEMMRFFE